MNFLYHLIDNVYVFGVLQSNMAQNIQLWNSYRAKRRELLARIEQR